MATYHIQQGGGFVQDHLVHWTLNLHTLKTGESGFWWTLNLDTLLISILIGIGFLWFFSYIARNAVSNKPPGRLQNLLEMIVNFIRNCIKESYHGESNLLGPMAFVILIWVFICSFMDLLPVDLVPRFFFCFWDSLFSSGANG